MKKSAEHHSHPGFWTFPVARGSFPRNRVIHMSKGKCTENPARREPMTVKVGGYRRKDGTPVDSHKRHKPK